MFLLLTMTASSMLIPNANAHTPAWTITDHAYIAAAPNPIGVGQTLVVTFWTAQPVPNTAITNNIRKDNYQLIITDPTGKNETQTFAVVQNTGGEQTITYVPSQAGTYTLTFNFLGQYYPLLSQVTSVTPLAAATIASINAFAGDYFAPASASMTFTVTQAPLPKTVYPLPTAYWTRPIEGENTYWYAIASNWLGPSSAQFGSTAESGYNCFQKDGTAPNSGHILWTKPIEMGGIVGGSNTGDVGATFYSGSSYEPRFYNAIIMGGYLYFKMPLSNAGGMTTFTNAAGQITSVYGGAYVCLDLRTGQLVWSNPNPLFTPTWGELYNEIDPNQSGVEPSGYLWQSIQTLGATLAANGGTTVPASVTWMAFDGFTGNWVFNVTNIPQNYNQYGPGGTLLFEQTSIAAYDSVGSLLKYVLDYNTATQSGWLGLWNVTQLAFTPNVVGANWRPIGKSLDGSTAAAYSWNVTFNGNLNGLVLNTTAPTGVSLGGPTFNAAIIGDILFGTSSGLSEAVGPQFTPNPFTMWAINLDPTKGKVGSILWDQNYTAPDVMSNNANLGSYTQRVADIDPQTRVITMMIGETMQWVGYALDTGKQVWGPTNTVFTDQYQFWGSGLGIGQNAIDAYGKIYVQGYGGCIWCYDTSNGNLLWTWGNGGPGNSTNDALDSPWGLLPTMITAAADGKVYGYTTQHGNGAQSPYYVNEFVFCLNATTGQQIWAMLSQCPNDGGPGYPEDIVADGELVYQNMYDNQIYAVGQGPSKTTVSAPDVGVSTATPITIQGTVMDISAGTKQNQQAADFPNGVPCVSDASQSGWMEYVYMQKPMPTNVTGVTVTLYVLDSNNNYRPIGTTTTDTSGTFAYTWTPDIPGDFTVYAAFAGTYSYWGSSAETHVHASAVVVTPPPTATPASNATTQTTFMVGVAAIIIVVIIIGALIMVMMSRKRP